MSDTTSPPNEPIRYQYKWAFYTQHPDGRIDVEVAVDPDAKDRIATFRIPAPNIDESERQKWVAEGERAIAFMGWIITEKKRVHNPAFDERGEQTTTHINARPCRTEDEAMAVAEKIADLIENYADEIPQPQ